MALPSNCCWPSPWPPCGRYTVARLPPAVLRRGEALLVVLVAQAAVGYTQYLTGDPVLLVGAHLAGATCVLVAMLAFNLSLYVRASTVTGQTGDDGPPLAWT